MPVAELSEDARAFVEVSVPTLSTVDADDSMVAMRMGKFCATVSCTFGFAAASGVFLEREGELLKTGSDSDSIGSDSVCVIEATMSLRLSGEMCFSRPRLRLSVEPGR